MSLKGASTRERHAQRIQRVIDYIHQNFASEIDSSTVAEVAQLSPYHWHRIYRAVTGESAIATLRRIRLERSAVTLLRDDRPVAAIAADCGFESLHAYTRLFRQAYGLPPGQFRASRGGLQVRCTDERLASDLPPDQPSEKSGNQPLERFGDNPDDIPCEYRGEERHQGTASQHLNKNTSPDTPAHVGHGQQTHQQVDIGKRKPLRLVGRHITGDYFEIGRVFEGLMVAAEIDSWPKAESYTVGVYYDDPDIVAPDACRAFAGIPVDDSFSVSRGYEELWVEGDSHASVLHVGPYALLPESYRWLYREWLRTTPLNVRDAPCHEIYLNTPYDTSPAKLETLICLPLAG